MATRFFAAVTAALLLISPATWAQSQSTDPPGRVGRLSAIEGAVQQRTPDDNDWVQANLNYPVTIGFAIAPQDGGRAEIQVGSMALRVGPVSELDVKNPFRVTFPLAYTPDRSSTCPVLSAKRSTGIPSFPRTVRCRFAIGVRSASGNRT